MVLQNYRPDFVLLLTLVPGINRQYFTPESQSLIRIFGGFSGLSLSFIPFIIPSFAPVLPQVVSSYARNFGVKNERLDDI